MNFEKLFFSMLTISAYLLTSYCNQLSRKSTSASDYGYNILMFFLLLKLDDASVSTIFSLWKNTVVSLLDRNLCANRWTNEYFEANSIAFNVAEESGTTDFSKKDVNVDVLPATKRRKRNAHKKFSEVMTACKKLSNTLSLCLENDFQRKLELAEAIKQLLDGEQYEVGLQLIDAWWHELT